MPDQNRAEQARKFDVRPNKKKKGGGSESHAFWALNDVGQFPGGVDCYDFNESKQRNYVGTTELSRKVWPRLSGQAFCR